MSADDKLNPDTSVWDWLTHDLRFHRERTGMSNVAVGKLLDRDPSNISNIMAGRRRIKDADAKRLDEAWEMGHHFRRLLQYARLGSDQEWFAQFAEHEKGARVIRTFQALAVHGLLQTPAYARALFAAAGATELDRLVDERMERQEVFNRPDPPTFWAVFTQSAIDTPVGGPDVIRAQLKHLLEMCELPHVGVRVIPRSAGAHGGTDGSFTILQGDAGDVAYTESPGGGRLVPSASELWEFGSRYDRVGQSALPEQPSRELIRKIMEAF